MKRSFKQLTGILVIAATLTTTSVVATNAGVRADTEPTVTAALTSSAKPTSAATSGQAATKQAAIQAAQAQVDQDNATLEQLKAKLAVVATDPAQSKAIRQAIESAKAQLASDQATLAQLKGETTAASSAGATTPATSTSAAPQTPVTQPAAPTAQALQSQAQAKANGYRIISDRVVDEQGNIINDWTVKDGVAYDDQGNAVALTTEQAAAQNTARVKLTSPQPAAVKAATHQSHTSWLSHWQRWKHAVTTWLNQW